jgi:hypothetical protein
VSTTDAIMIAGLGTIPVGFLLAWWLKAKGAGDDLGGLGLPVDVCMLFVWGGMLLIQAANILLHKQTGSLYNVSALTWAASSAVLFVCGCFAGRLFLRLEFHRYRQKRDAQISN